MNKKSAVLPWVSMGLLALVSLGGCSSGIDFSFKAPEEERVNSNLPAEDPMAQDNQRIIDDARREGKIDPQVFPAKR
ncbi:hypothetical protein [Shewanella algae]|uniref:hypothetical protein n=1 Tax=Shewanella algae TaxID=38313 RepID=UPI000D4888BB|nr:hypothetical protein [Shewanella algae]PSS70742.1 hypothetical protein AYI88_16265 [Shewanella algae]